MKPNKISFCIFVIGAVMVSVAIFGPRFGLHFYDTIIASLVLGSASLIVSLASRNVSISERARDIARELQTVIPDKRRTLLKAEVTVFRERYGFNQLALLCQFFGLAMFIGMFVFASAGYLVQASVLFYLGLGALLIGFTVTFVDISRSSTTLFDELDYALSFDVSNAENEDEQT